MEVARFRKKPVLGILRGISPKTLDPLLETIISSGLETIEFAMNAPGAADLIRQASRRGKGTLMIGAGTVLDLRTLHAALRAGASFVVSPVLVEPVARYCVKQKIPFFPGAFTPTEIYKAWQAGATMVKVFPAGGLGPAYFREVKGPFPQIELLACSGVRPETTRNYFQNGASAIAFGSSVFCKKWVDQGQFPKVRQKIRSYLSAIPEKVS